MKTIKNSDNIKTRVVSFAVILALVLCSLLSFGLLGSGSGAFAAGAQGSDIKDNGGIRFSQVEAGEDFAIGLTYDGKLYGWSLTADPSRTTLNPGADTLGGYYTATPTEINVTFRLGTAGNGWRFWGDEGNGNNYHEERTDEAIKSIATTRTTAAFVTKYGYIYTWGKDGTRDVAHSATDSKNYLLLRNPDVASIGGATVNWYTPYIIDYHYSRNGKPGAELTDRDIYPQAAVGTNIHPIEALIPNSSGNADLFTSLVGGEYNYTFLFERTYVGNMHGQQANPAYYYHVFSWGSLMYNAVNRTHYRVNLSYLANESTNENNMLAQDTATAGRVYNTFISSRGASNALIDGVSAYAGSYTVGINNTRSGVSGGTSLQVHGKNFITSQPLTKTGDGNAYSPKYTVQTLDSYPYGVTSGDMTAPAKSIGYSQSNAQYEITNALAGSRAVSENQANGDVLYGADTELYYARQAAAGGATRYEVASASAIVGARGQAIGESTILPVHNAVSLGNDIGYGISGGALFGWGDNVSGQLAADTEAVKYSSTPTQITLNELRGATVTSVAAGKQLTPVTSTMNSTGIAFNYANTLGEAATETTGEGESAVTTTTVPFTGSVQNGTAYISAALDSNGYIHAWSKNQSPVKLAFMDRDDSGRESFAAVYSGYGNNLFAVTVGGKLVRITDVNKGTAETPQYAFEQYLYDEFNNADGSRKANWTVAEANTVAFNLPEYSEENPEPADITTADLGSATFYVFDYTASDNVAFNGGGEGSAYRSLIAENIIGDAYRIVGFDEKDLNINFLKAEKLTNGGPAEATYFKPVFKFDGNIMTEKQQQNMFDFGLVYNNSNEVVGMRISPKQSTKGKTVTVEFKIARFNYYGRYAGATDNAIYYDWKDCSIRFTVADTRSLKVFSAFAGADGTGNSMIPLLDPNNSYNRSYSLAVQDVSTGVTELVKFLGGHAGAVNTTATENAFVADAVSEMNTEDAGFPNASKIDAGDLDYYLSADDQAKYNSRYQFLFKDRDGDRVVINRPGDGNEPISSERGITSAIASVNVRVQLKDGYFNADHFKKADDTPLTDAEITKLISTDFDNKYGLYNISYVTEEDTAYLSFTYQVLTFTATASTGALAYGSEDVKSYATTNISGAEPARANVWASTIVGFDYSDTNGYVEKPESAVLYDTTATLNIASVFSQPTLRFERNGTVYTGERSGGSNRYTEDRPVISVGETSTIYLSEYVGVTDSTMSFSFKNAVDTDGLKLFNDQFTDYTGNNIPVVTLQGGQIIVHPTTAAPIRFTVELQRFRNTEKIDFFGAENSEDEKIYLTFNFPTVQGFNLTEGNADKTYLVTKTSTISLFGTGGEAADLLNREHPFVRFTRDGGSVVQGATLTELENRAVMVGVSSSEDRKTEAQKIFNVVAAADGKSFTITPYKSGAGAIQFSVNSYGKSMSFSLTINVSKETTIPDTVTVIDNQYVYVSELTAALVEANSFNDNKDNYKILYADAANAISFYDAAGPMAGSSLPPFIRAVEFENVATNPSIRIVTNNTSVQNSQTYYMHVKFTYDNVNTYAEARPESIIEIIVPVESGKIKLRNDAGDLIANINCRHTQAEGNWWTTSGDGLDTRVTISLDYLLELDKSLTDREKYKIFLLSADGDVPSYFQYDKGAGDRTIVITPVNNTREDGYELNVSVYKDDGSSADTSSRVYSFLVSVSGIITTLPTMTDDGVIGYGNIWLYSFAIVFGVLAIIFIIRFIVYIRRRAKQRAIIKRNQELIRMRDRMHGKANAASREQLVRSKMKMEDPKYAKMFNDMRRDKEDETGVSLDNSDLAATAARKSKKKKKKGGKKSVAELKAELEAKKAAFAAAQSQNQPVNPFGDDMPPMDGGFGDVPPMEGGFGDVPPMDGGFAADGSDIVFDASDIGDGNM